MPWSDSISLATIRVQLNNFRRTRSCSAERTVFWRITFPLTYKPARQRQEQAQLLVVGFAFALANPVICACA